MFFFLTQTCLLPHRSIDRSIDMLITLNPHSYFSNIIHSFIHFTANIPSYISLFILFLRNINVWLNQYISLFNLKTCTLKRCLSRRSHRDSPSFHYPFIMLTFKAFLHLKRSRKKKENKGLFHSFFF